MYRVTKSRTGLARLVAAAAVLAGVCAGSAWAQVRVSGLEAAPVGAASLSPLPDGALLVSDIGGSGLDGVELRCNSAWGCGMSVDMSALLASSPVPEARDVTLHHRGWDGTIKGSLRVAGRPTGGGFDLECDLSAVGAQTVRIRLRDAAGNAVHTSVTSGPVFTCSADVTFPPGSPNMVSLSACCNGTHLDDRPPRRRVRATAMILDVGTHGLCDVHTGGATHHAVRTIEFEVESCATCDVQHGVQASVLTIRGLAQCVVSDAHVLSFWTRVSGVGGAHADELCADPGDCDNVRRVRVSSLGVGGQDGVAISLRDDLSAGGGGGGGSVVLRKGELTGHVTLMKAFDEDGAETGRVSRYHDTFQNRQWLEYLGLEAGAEEVTASLRDAAGQEIDRLTIGGPLHAVRVVSGAPGGAERWSCHSGRWSVEFPVDFTVQLGNGAVHAGVRSVHFAPLGGSSQERCRELHVLANAAAGPVDVLACDVAPARVALDGLTVAALGAASVSHVPGGVLRVQSPCCPSGSGDDGVEVRLHSTAGGSVGMDVSPLLQAASSPRRIRIRNKGLSGLLFGNHRLSSVPGDPGSIDVTLDYSSMGATGIEWVAVREGGRTVGAGQVSEIVFRCTPIGGGGGGGHVWRAIGCKGSGIKFYDEIEFAEAACVVTGLGPTPLTDVIAVRVRPLECPGCVPWTDLDSMEVTMEGFETLDLHGAALHTFDASSAAVGGATIRERCDDTNHCDTSRLLEVRDLGSTGEDGVEIRLGRSGDTAFDGANLWVAAGTARRAWVILMKAFDDDGGEVMRVTQSSDEDGASHAMEFDWSARPGGPHAATVAILDASDQVLVSFAASGSGAFTYIAPCDASRRRSVGCDGNEYELELCDGPVTVFAQGMPVPNARKVRVRVDAPPGANHPRSLRFTGNPTDYLEISGLELIEPPPACAADFDGNGAREVSDIFAFLSAWFAGQPAAFNFGGVPGVPAIFAFLTAWFAGC